MRALRAVVKQSSFHPKSCEKIRISLPPLSGCAPAPHTHTTYYTVELGKGGEPLEQHFG